MDQVQSRNRGFSSRTVELPPLVLPGIEVIPLIVRHPIDRIRGGAVVSGAGLGAATRRGRIVRAWAWGRRRIRPVRGASCGTPIPGRLRILPARYAIAGFRNSVATVRSTWMSPASKRSRRDSGRGSDIGGRRGKWSCFFCPGSAREGGDWPDSSLRALKTRCAGPASCRRPERML